MSRQNGNEGAPAIVAVVIENPILNSAYAEPTRHFRFDDDGITEEIAESRRLSSYFVPIPAARRRGGQQAFDTEWTKDRVAENETVNRIRDLVAHWRSQGHPGVTPTTRLLLEHWRDPERDNRLFFCQVEAAEAAIYLTEAAPKLGGQWIVNKLREDAERHNPGLFRVAHKMATGTGKTVLMAMLIAWQTLNKVASPQDARFTDAFLFVTPGITIRDRLRVLLPSDPGNYYRERDLVPAGLTDQLGRARIVITNFHAFLPRETGIGKASKLTKELLSAGNGPNPFTETPVQIVEPGLSRSRDQAPDRRLERRGTPLLPAPSGGRGRGPEARRRRPPGGQDPRRGGTGLDHRALLGAGEDRHQDDLRPIGDTVLSPRLGLLRRHLISLGRV